MPSLIRRLGSRTLIELGAGSAEKSRIILDAMRAAGTAELYVPIDVSATFLSQTAARLRREYPRLAVEPAIADISEELNFPRRVPRPALFAFLGGTIGNFYPPGRDPAARPGARRDGAGRPVPHGRGPAEGRRAHRGGLQRQPRASRRSSTGTCCWC